jgi:hypothetical protein
LGHQALRPEGLGEQVEIRRVPAGQRDRLIRQGGEKAGLGGIGAHQVRGRGAVVKHIEARGPLGLDRGIGREHHRRSPDHVGPDIESQHGFARPWRRRNMQAPLGPRGEFLAGEFDHIALRGPQSAVKL